MSMSYHENFADALPEMARVKEERNDLKRPESNTFCRAGSICWVYRKRNLYRSAILNVVYGQGPQFAVHSISFVPELGPADPIRFRFLIWIA